MGLCNDIFKIYDYQVLENAINLLKIYPKNRVDKLNQIGEISANWHYLYVCYIAIHIQALSEMRKNITKTKGL